MVDVPAVPMCGLSILKGNVLPFAVTSEFSLVIDKREKKNTTLPVINKSNCISLLPSPPSTLLRVLHGSSRFILTWSCTKMMAEGEYNSQNILIYGEVKCRYHQLLKEILPLC